MYSKKLNERMSCSMKLKEGKSSMVLERNKNCEIERLPDDVLMEILSFMRLNESVRTSVLGRRWRYLWMAAHKSLVFECTDTDHTATTGKQVMEKEKFDAWVDTVLKLHKGRRDIRGLVVRFNGKGATHTHSHSHSQRYDAAVDSWVYYALDHQLETFELNLSPDTDTDTGTGSYYGGYVFPTVLSSSSISNEYWVLDSPLDLPTPYSPYNSPSPSYSPYSSISISSSRSTTRTSTNSPPPPDHDHDPYPFWRLRSLVLAHVDIHDDGVHYFVDSCPNLDELRIRSSSLTKNLRLTNPPRLRILEISRCSNILNVEISAGSLVSLEYDGPAHTLRFLHLPNLSQLAIAGASSFFFLIHPQPLYSLQLIHHLLLDFRYLDFDTREIAIVGLPDLPHLCSLKRLQVRVFREADHHHHHGDLLFFAALINACPQLREFRIELSYPLYPAELNIGKTEFPAMEEVAIANATNFVHQRLKVVEMGGFIGLPSEQELLLLLHHNCPAIHTMLIDTHSHYYSTHRSRPRSYFRFLKGCFPATGVIHVTRDMARERANDVVSNFTRPINTIVT